MNLLADLLAYAVANRTFTAFRSATIHARLVLNARGYVHVEAAEKTGVRVDTLNETRSGTSVKAYFLYDNPEYVLGIESDPKRTKARFDAFWDRAEADLAATGDKAALKAVRAARRDFRWLKSARTAALKLKGRDDHLTIALALEGDTTTMIERPPIRGHLTQKLYAAINATGSATCLVTATPCEPVVLHTPIRGVPGTGGSAPLVSFHAPSADYKLRHGQGRNFPTSEYAVRGYTSALESLLKTNRFVTGACVCGVVWGPGNAPSIARVIAGAFADPAALDRAWLDIEAMRSAPDEMVRVLTLKGSRGRIAILGYTQLRSRDVATNLLRFRAHFRTTRYDAESDTRQRIEPSVLRKLSELTPRSGRPARPGKDDPGQVLDPITKAHAVAYLLEHGRLPRTAHERVLARLNSAHPAALAQTTNTQSQKAIYYAYRTQLDWYAFHDEQRPSHGEHIMSQPACEPSITDFAAEPERFGDYYRLGRLIALEEALSQDAHQRTVGNGSSLGMIHNAPATWFNNHTHRIHVYRDKMRRRDMFGTTFTKLYADIVCRVHSDTISRSAPLNAQEKASLMLGFEHQRAYNGAYRQYRHARRKAAATAATEAA